MATLQELRDRGCTCIAHWYGDGAATLVANPSCPLHGSFGDDLDGA